MEAHEARHATQRAGTRSPVQRAFGRAGCGFQLSGRTARRQANASLRIFHSRTAADAIVKARNERARVSSNSVL